MSEFSTLFRQGYLTWISDRSKLRLQLLIWPILLPFLMLAFMVITIAVMSTRIEASHQGSSPNEPVKIGLTPGEYFEPIATVLKARLGYDVESISEDVLRQNISDGSILFGIKQDVDKDHVNLTVIYDRQRDYVNKNWLDDTEDSLADVAHAVSSAHLGLTIQPDNGLPRLRFEIAAYGKSAGVSLALALLFILYIVLVIYPLDIAKSVLNQLYIEDVTHGHLQLLNNAKISPLTVVLARWLSALFVFAISLSIIAIYCMLFLTVYREFSGYIAQVAEPAFLQKPELYPMVLGFNQFYDGISFGQLTQLWASFTLIGATALALLTYPAVKSDNLEQARTRAKLIDIILFNIPVLAYIVGAATPSSWLQFAPILNQYHYSLLTMNGYTVGLANQLTGLAFIVIIFVAMFYVVRNHFFADNRVIG